MFGWILDKIGDIVVWWERVGLENERQKLARMKAKDEDESMLVDLEVQAMDAEANRLSVETRLKKA